MSKNLSAKYDQEDKKGPHKKVRERYQNHFKEEKEKKQQVVNFTKISQKMKNKSLLSAEESIIE